ncbi:MAG: hypothetical protein AAGG44_21445 [Planctomycetota bacterium]
MNPDPSDKSPESPLDADIESSLQRQFAPGSPSQDHLAELRSAFQTAKSETPASAENTVPTRSRSFSRSQLLASLAVAACLLIAVAIWSPKSWWSSNDSPAFEPVPLASLYDDAVQRGFTPYYDCSDESRFLATMRHRHRVDLKINTDLDASQDVRMLGVSYSGGLSRNSTVILFIAYEKPVMVFVDNDDIRVPSVALDKSPNPELKTYETRRDGLVFVEVSPFDEAIATPKIELIGD